jgi:hypothetical protein
MGNSTSLRSSFVALSTALALGACATTRPAAPPTPPTVRFADGSPQAVLTQMQIAATSHGWRIADAGVDSLLVDFGTSGVRMPLPDTAAPRETEIHGTALYVVRPAASGAEILVVDNPIYWHPDLACWLPGPAGVLPSAQLLPPDARPGTR